MENERYSLEQAQDGAETLREKVESGEASDYAEAERIETINQIQNRYVALAKAVSEGRDYYGQIDGPLGWLGGDTHIGTETVHNSPMQSAQLLVTLAMSRDPRIEKIIENPLSPQIFQAKNKHEFLEKWEGVLKGLKVLDLGCGVLPTFSKVARGLGAEVYTLDVFPAEWFENFKPDYNGKKDPMFESAKKYHIQENLSNRGAFDTIKKITGGEFDLVTAAHLQSLTVHKGIDFYYYIKPEECSPLLKKGGIFYDVNKTRGWSVEKDDEHLQDSLGLIVK